MEDDNNMKLKKNYDFARYSFLLTRGKKILDELSRVELAKHYEKIAILKKLGITNICVGKSKIPLSYIDNFYALHRSLVSRKNEAGFYLIKHKKKFEKDLAEGKLAGLVSEQLELDFKEYKKFGDLTIENKQFRYRRC